MATSFPPSDLTSLLVNLPVPCPGEASASFPLARSDTTTPALTPQMEHGTLGPPPIGTNHKRVLLMLDMQRCMLEADGPPSAKKVIANVEQVLMYARASTHPPLIVHVRNAGDIGEPDEVDSAGWQLIFDPLPNEPVIDKRKNNAFAGTVLGALVAVDAEIVVVGFQTDFSVRATCSAALGRGNDVILLREAHATFDRIEVLHGGGITAAAMIEAEIEEELEEAGVHIFEIKDLPSIFSDR